MAGSLDRAACFISASLDLLETSLFSRVRGGSNIIKGTVKIFSEDKNEYNNVGMTMMIPNLNRTNIVLDEDYSFQIKSLILGLVNFVGDADGNIIRNNLASIVSEANQAENHSKAKSVQELGSASDLSTSESIEDSVGSGDVGSEGEDVGSEGENLKHKNVWQKSVGSGRGWTTMEGEDVRWERRTDWNRRERTLDRRGRGVTK